MNHESVIVGILCIYLLISIVTSLPGLYTPQFISNVLQLDAIVLGMYYRWDRIFILLLCALLSVLHLLDIIVNSLYLSQPIYNGTITYMGISITTNFSMQYGFVIHYVVCILMVVLFTILLVKKIRGIYQIVPMHPIQYLTDSVMFLYIYCTIFLWYYPPHLQLYPNPHIVTLYVITSYIPTIKNKTVGIYIAFALASEVVYLTCMFYLEPRWLEYSFYENSSIFNTVQYRHVQPISRFLNFAIHVLDLIIFCTVLIVASVWILVEVKI